MDDSGIEGAALSVFVDAKRAVELRGIVPGINNYLQRFHQAALQQIHYGEEDGLDENLEALVYEMIMQVDDEMGEPGPQVSASAVEETPQESAVGDGALSSFEEHGLRQAGARNTVMPSTTTTVVGRLDDFDFSNVTSSSDAAIWAREIYEALSSEILNAFHKIASPTPGSSRCKRRFIEEAISVVEDLHEVYGEEDEGWLLVRTELESQIKDFKGGVLVDTDAFRIESAEESSDPTIGDMKVDERTQPSDETIQDQSVSSASVAGLQKLLGEFEEASADAVDAFLQCREVIADIWKIDGGKAGQLALKLQGKVVEELAHWQEINWRLRNGLHPDDSSDEEFGDEVGTDETAEEVSQHYGEKRKRAEGEDAVSAQEEGGSKRRKAQEEGDGSDGNAVDNGNDRGGGAIR